MKRSTLTAIAPVVIALSMLSCAAAPAAGKETEVKRPAIGEKAIDFDLPIVGEDGFLELKDQYKQGAVVVVVLRGYPGYQCPLCNQQVGSMASRAKTLAKAAHRVILVYPGEQKLLERHAEQFMGSRRLPEPMVLVRDEGLNMVTEWGLRWKGFKETAYPATFVIDRNGRIRWSKISDSHAGRSTTEEILRELRKL